MSSTAGLAVSFDLSPDLVFLACLFNVSSDYGKYFCTIAPVSPGKDTYCPLLVALSHVGLVGNPAAAC